MVINLTNQELTEKEIQKRMVIAKKDFNAAVDLYKIMVKGKTGKEREAAINRFRCG